MLAPGVRVVRGPNWSWQNQDGGEGYVGTVCEIGKTGSSSSPDKTVVVQWDSGFRSNYRVGYQGHFDLRIYDNAQIGVKHPNIICDGCKKHGIAGMLYNCIQCNDYDLCSFCYHGDVHDLSHPFQRFDLANSQGVELTIRKDTPKCELRGIFVGAKVIRGYNWEWGNQDGGDGKPGRVMDIRGWDNESARSVANVTWVSGTTNVYRLGHKGYCDLKFVQEATGGTYYPTHLPVLGQHTETAAPRALHPRNNGSLFSVGDKVQVTVEVDSLKVMQQGHGGWNPRMAKYVGKIGTVHRVTDKGDIRVQYEDCNNRWTFNPAALCKINTFSIGDVVCVLNDQAKVRELQKGHGEWIDVMKNALGKLGKIIKVYSDGDLRIQLDGRAWTLNPQCVRLVPGSATELSNTMQADQNQRLEPSMQQWLPATQYATSADRLVRDAAQGRLEAVKTVLDQHPGHVDLRSGGKTSLQVAAHQGHAQIVAYLLTKGAYVNAVDTDGDTTLHYAAFGNQPEVMDLLLRHGADINAVNKGSCTALHIAAHKQPVNCVTLLLSRGADVNIQDSYGDTALHDAIGKESCQVIDLLCEAPGVDFTIRNKRGFNVLHHAALKGNSYATHKLLTKTRQLVDVKKDDGFSALHLAALNGHKDVVETLIRVGQADVDLRNNRQQSALLLAVSQGHCAVIELLVKLKANVNAKDEDGDTALHVALLKRANITSEIRQEDSPAIFAIYQQLSYVSEYRIALAIACYLIQVRCDIETLNAKNQTAISLLQDQELEELLKAYKPNTNLANADVVHDISVNISEISLGTDLRQVPEGFNLTEFSPRNSPSHNSNSSDNSSGRKSRSIARRGPEESNKLDNAACVVKEPSSPKMSSRKPAECSVCSELSEENVCLEPCGHKPACEDCASRMKKCLQCGCCVQKRVTKDGRIIPAKSRQPSAERMRYLECKIAEIEETHGCSICMERRRNIVFLCGHGACSKCADTLKTCHMCRKTITKKIPIY